MTKWCDYGSKTKVKYPDETSANRAKMNLWGADPSADLNDLHVYLCPKCSQWHVGHKSKFKGTNQ